MTTKENPSPSPVVQPAEAPAEAVAPAKAPAKARAPRKATSVEQTVAKHQQALAEALEKAEAISYDPPQAPKAAKPTKASAKAKVEKVEKVEKPAKPKKPRLVRDSYAMPETEYAQIAMLKKRLVALGAEVKKSELLRAGIAVLAALNDAELQAVMGRIERIKTGRPAKK
ncbi:hypothetical protein [Azonexus sp.]|uniref:hypothetical protein n=1 Tax=Azonexus sp. TaxID=1872668 RepID=UPI0035B2ACFE